MPTDGLAARPDDAVCKRSTDSLAAEIGDLLPARVLNLACPDATVTAGLRGPQDIGGQQVPAQVGLLRQVQGLRFVVVEIGPNDVGWTDFLRYCYGVPDCADALTQNEFDYRLAAFDRAYGDLLVDLNDLPGRPQVIVVASYGAFAGDADCADTKAAGYPGLDPAKIALLTARNDQLNTVLTAGADKYGFAMARPELSLLCDPHSDGLGPDIQGMADPFPFHPMGSAPCARPPRWSDWSTRRRSVRPPPADHGRRASGSSRFPARRRAALLPGVPQRRQRSRGPTGRGRPRLSIRGRWSRTALCTGSCTSTWISSSRPSSCCAARSWPGGRWSSAATVTPPAAVSSPRRPTPPASTASIPACRCARRHVAARTPSFCRRTTRRMRRRRRR